jgi:hypothetical protein
MIWKIKRIGGNNTDLQCTIMNGKPPVLFMIVEHNTVILRKYRIHYRNKLDGYNWKMKANQSEHDVINMMCRVIINE